MGYKVNKLTETNDYRTGFYLEILINVDLNSAAPAFSSYKIVKKYLGLYASTYGTLKA